MRNPPLDDWRILQQRNRRKIKHLRQCGSKPHRRDDGKNRIPLPHPTRRQSERSWDCHPRSKHRRNLTKYTYEKRDKTLFSEALIFHTLCFSFHSRAKENFTSSTSTGLPFSYHSSSLSKRLSIPYSFGFTISGVSRIFFFFIFQVFPLTAFIFLVCLFADNCNFIYMGTHFTVHICSHLGKLHL